MTAGEAPSIVTAFFDPARSAMNASGNAVVARSEDVPRRDRFAGRSIERLRQAAFRPRALCRSQQLRFVFWDVNRVLDCWILKLPRLNVQVPAAVRERNGGRRVRFDCDAGKSADRSAMLAARRARRNQVSEPVIQAIRLQFGETESASSHDWRQERDSKRRPVDLTAFHQTKYK
jgi:hypothetical protein